MSERITTLIALSERVKAATGPDIDLDLALAKALVPDVIVARHDCNSGLNVSHTYWEYTLKIDDAVALLKRTLPGWWWAVGTRGVSDNARIAPDYDSQEHGERLKREFPYIDGRGGRLVWSKFDEGFDVDRRPSGNVPLALLEAMLDALIYIEETRLHSEKEAGE